MITRPCTRRLPGDPQPIEHAAKALEDLQFDHFRDALVLRVDAGVLPMLFRRSTRVLEHGPTIACAAN